MSIDIIWVFLEWVSPSHHGFNIFNILSHGHDLDDWGYPHDFGNHHIYILWIPRGYHTMVGALPPQGSFPSCFQPITNSSWSAGTQKILRLASISPGMPHLWPQDTSTRFSSHRRFAHESNPSLTLKIAVKHGQDWRPQSVKYGKWLGLTRHNPMVQVLMRRNY